MKPVLAYALKPYKSYYKIVKQLFMRRNTMKTVFAYAFKPSKSYSKIIKHLRPSEGILCYTTDKNDYTEERNSMATIQPYFIPMSKKGNLQWYKARKVDNVVIMGTMLDAVAMYNLDIRRYVRKLQEKVNFMSKLIIDGDDYYGIAKG